MSELHTYPFQAMGSDCALYLYAASELAERAAEAATGEVLRIEEKYSRYRADSFLARINQAAATGGEIEVDAETAGLLDYAFACHRKSDGLFDISSGLLRQAWDFSADHPPSAHVVERLLPRIGLDKVAWLPPQLIFNQAAMELDFGGIGKEYAADRAADLCAELGVVSGLIDLGGDIRVLGPQPDGSPWTILIRNSERPDTPVANVALNLGAIATSGDYERYLEIDGRRHCHILDPRTGWPAQGLSSVSVQAESCLVAGSVATIAMLKGKEGAAWLETLGVRHLWQDGRGGLGGDMLA